MTLEQLNTERQAAGKAYADALARLQDAWVRLAAIDRTLRNGNVNPHESIRSWHFRRLELADSVRALQHTEFCPRIDAREWNRAAEALSDLQIHKSS